MPIYVIQPKDIEAFASPEKLESFWNEYPPHNYPLDRIPKEPLKQFLGTCKAEDPKFQLLYEDLVKNMLHRDMFKLPVAAYFTDEEHDNTKEVRALMLKNGDYTNPECNIRQDLEGVSDEELKAYLKRIGTFQNVGNLLGILRVMEAGFPEVKEDLEMQNFAMDCYDKAKRGEGKAGVLRTKATHFADQQMRIMYDDTVQPFTGFGKLDMPCWMMKSNGCTQYAQEYIHTYIMAYNHKRDWVMRFIKNGVKDFLGDIDSGKYSFEWQGCRDYAEAYEKVGFFKEFGVKYSSKNREISEI